MKEAILKAMTVLLLICVGGFTAMAQDTFNPTNPPEPNQLYKVKVSAEPVEAAYVSGIGQYRTGEVASLHCSSRAEGFQFQYWTKNGEVYSENQSFSYTVGTEDANFVAVFKYAPDSPEEPNVINKNRLYLEPMPEACCSFNRTSGEKVEAGDWVWVEAYPNQGFEFSGWYRNGQLVNTEHAFSYMMPNENTTLTAKFKFNPLNPSEPGGTGQTGIANGKLGDLNGDSSVNITDVVALVNVCLNGTDVSLKVADMNGDGSVNITDVVSLVNKCLNGQ